MVKRIRLVSQEIPILSFCSSVPTIFAFWKTLNPEIFNLLLVEVCWYTLADSKLELSVPVIDTSGTPAAPLSELMPSASSCTDAEG
ncbi:hypothetical protein [Paenibacillus sonchi]|uniref:hypothetical protein n=1 Tax=Paenibacillus sonchi TaxID=373687 RepID=UPI001F2C3F98|nr:hypothetical protein [Paenibacillus sonchi]